MKKCGSCKLEKPYEEFNKRKASVDGYANMCRECNRKYQKKYNVNNSDRLSDYKKTWRENNREYMKDYLKDYYKSNKETLNQKKKEYYNLNKSYFNELGKKYYQDHKKELLQWHKEHNKERYYNNPEYNLQVKVRRRLWSFFKNKSKTGRTKEMLGCSWDQLKNHLESQFKDGMSWDNMGKFGWHIDHIIPLSSAKSEVEIMKLCHYTNLQPLWWLENLKKSNKVQSNG